MDGALGHFPGPVAENSIGWRGCPTQSVSWVSGQEARGRVGAQEKRLLPRRLQQEVGTGLGVRALGNHPKQGRLRRLITLEPPMTRPTQMLQSSALKGTAAPH